MPRNVAVAEHKAEKHSNPEVCLGQIRDFHRFHHPRFISLYVLREP